MAARAETPKPKAACQTNGRQLRLYLYPRRNSSRIAAEFQPQGVLRDHAVGEWNELLEAIEVRLLEGFTEWELPRLFRVPIWVKAWRHQPVLTALSGVGVLGVLCGVGVYVAVLACCGFGLRLNVEKRMET